MSLMSHDELQRAVAQKTSSLSGGRSARASAFWDQHPWLSEVLICVTLICVALICAAVLFHLLKLIVFWLMANKLKERAAARWRKEACARRISIDDGQEPRGTRVQRGTARSPCGRGGGKPGNRRRPFISRRARRLIYSPRPP